MLLHIRALLQLLRLEYYILRGDFPLLYQKVREYPLAAKEPSPELLASLCSAVDLVCMWYPKRVLCLQRSAATACLLRKYGSPAEMIIGIQKLPFKAHAWIEVHGCVVNDKPYTPEMYTALDRW
jgi:hypothetical protein